MAMKQLFHRVLKDCLQVQVSPGLQVANTRSRPTTTDSPRVSACTQGRPRSLRANSRANTGAQAPSPLSSSSSAAAAGRARLPARRRGGRWYRAQKHRPGGTGTGAPGTVQATQGTAGTTEGTFTALGPVSPGAAAGAASRGAPGPGAASRRTEASARVGDGAPLAPRAEPATLIPRSPTRGAGAVPGAPRRRPGRGPAAAAGRRGARPAGRGRACHANEGARPPELWGGRGGEEVASAAPRGRGGGPGGRAGAAGKSGRRGAPPGRG